MSKPFKYISYCLGIMIFILGCQADDDIITSDVDPLLLNEYTVRYPELRIADSLYLYFQTDNAISEYKTLMKESPIDSIRMYAATKLSEMKFQYEFLYHEIEDVDSSLVIDEMSFYRTLRLYPDSLNVNHLKKKLSNTKYLGDSLMLLTQLSICEEVIDNDNYEAIEDWVNQAYEVLNSNSQSTVIHHDTYKQLIKLKSYRRLNLLGVGLANDHISAMNRLENVDNKFKVDALLSRAYALASTGSYNQECLLECKKILESIKDRCSPQYLSAVGCASYVIDDTIKTNNTIKKLLKYKSECDSNLINIDRIVAQLSFYKQQYELAKKYGLLAKEFEEKNIYKNGKQYEIILYILSIVSQKVNEHDAALDFYYENKKIAGVDNYEVFELLQRNDVANYFITFLRFAEIHYAKWQSQNSKEDLNYAILLLKKAEENMNSQLTTIDENAMLRFFNYQNSIYEQLSNAYRDKYKITGSKKYQYDIVETLSKKKNLLLQREISMKSDSRYVSQELKKRRKELLKEVESVKLQGIVDNIQLSDVLIRMEETANEIKLSYGKNNIDALKLKDRLNTEEISEILNTNTCMISYYIMEEELIIVFYEKDNIEIFYQDIDETFLTDLKLVSEYQSDVFLSEVNNYQRISYKIFQMLFPDDLYTKCKDRIVVIPDGPLNYINMEALVNNYSENSNSFSDLNYLIEDHEISYLPSDQLIENCKDDIDIGSISEVDVFSFSDNGTIDAVKQTYLSELPFAIKETEIIIDYFTSANRYTGANATKENFVQSLSNNNGYIHVSTHGSSDPTGDDQLKLYFRNPDFTLDSLQAYELLDIESKTEVIFLSSCQSGSGHLIDVEGVFDLKRYFLLSGVNRIVSSIWNVDDYTSQQMTLFLLQNNFNLRKAKLQFLDQNIRRSHPYYWAGYVY